MSRDASIGSTIVSAVSRGLQDGQSVSFREALARACREEPGLRWLTLSGPSGEKSVSIHELAARTRDYCLFYASLGVQQGDTVLIILRESADLFASFFAGIIYGALPAFYAYPSPKQSQEAFLGSVEDLVRYNRIRLVVAFDEVVDTLRHHASFPADTFLGYCRPQDVPSLGDADLDTLAPANREAFLQFSSGTTGAKKGVRISAEALSNQVRAYRRCVHFDAASRIVSWLPHYHDMGLIACMLMPVLARVPIVMMSPFEWVRHPRLLLDAITKHRGTHVWLPNFALGHLFRSVPSEEVPQFDLSSLRQLICCSEPVLDETVSRFVEKFRPAGLGGDVLFNCYAMAENTFAMTSTRNGRLTFLSVDADHLRRNHQVRLADHGEMIASTGSPLENIRLRILDSSGRDVVPDVVGEIAIQSDCMLDGYHNNPAATEAAFHEGYFKTGDLGFLHDGELYITGRAKDMIIVGGENIYPQDIEQFVNDESGLVPGRNVAFGVHDERIGTERIVVLAECRDWPSTVDMTNLQAKVFGALGVSLSEVLLLPHMTLRKGTAGKISRHLNKLDYLAGRFSQPESTVQDLPSPVAADHEAVVAVIHSVLPGNRKPPIDVETLLLSSGIIDSFAFVELIHALEKAFQLTIPETMWTPEALQSPRSIVETICALKEARTLPTRVEGEWRQQRAESFERLRQARPQAVTERFRFWEYVINRCPLRASWLYRLLLRAAGIQVGRNVKCLGRVKVKLRGLAANIIIGDNVVLGDNVDLRNREQGRIVLHDRAYLDHNVRLVAARAGMIEIGSGTEVGANTVINSGGTTRIGSYVMIASNVNINSSQHGTDKDAYIKEQPHTHGQIVIADDVWIGSGASVLLNTSIGEGAVIGSASLVSGEIPPFAVCVGVPARVIRYRS